MGANILKELGGDRAEQSEFEELILEHFGLASHPSNDEILYSRPETEASLKLVYDRDGFLARAETIADLSADDIGVIRRKVEEQLLTPGPIKVRKRILLTAIPTKGWFRSRDRFQIVPVPADAPRPHFLHADPCVLGAVSMAVMEHRSPPPMELEHRTGRRAVCGEQVAAGGIYLAQRCSRNGGFLRNRRTSCTRVCRPENLLLTPSCRPKPGYSRRLRSARR